MVLYLGEERIRDLLHWDQLISTIEEGKRYLGTMPAVAGDAMGAKLVSFYPGNAGSIYTWY